jgi:hypothetical protein
MAVKTDKEPLVTKDLACGGMTDWRRQTMEVNWPLFNESPTYSILFPLSASSIIVALKLHALYIYIYLFIYIQIKLN